MRLRSTIKLSFLFVFASLLIAGVSLWPPAGRPALAQVAPGRHIVVLNDNVQDAAAVAQALAAQHDLQVTAVYQHALKGFAFTGPDAAARAIARNPFVAFVEPDVVVDAHCHQGDPQVVPTGIPRTFADMNPNITINDNDDLRIDVDVAVLDTGIDLDHFDLNVVAGVDCTKGPSCEKGGDGDDGNGHGTHVSGTIAALDGGGGVVGVAPGARLWAVKVLRDDGSGFLSDVAEGIDYVTANAGHIEVANMSLGCECTSNALDMAIATSVGMGVVYVVSAGNSNADASAFSPANHPDVITVSALADFDGALGGLAQATCRSDVDDTLADFSNWGPLIEITAPGVCILSTWKDGMCAVLDGTSMSSPHVAGAAALLAASGFSDPGTIRQTLVAAGSLAWTDDSGDGTQESLLDVSDTGVFNPATVAGPSAAACSVGTDCAVGEVCCGGTCSTPVCSAHVDCDDADACTTDTCTGSGSCAATCVNDPIPECGCLLAGSSCTGNAECCSGNCKGKPGNKTCK
jgi:subtilisin family serine protease